MPAGLEEVFPGHHNVLERCGFLLVESNLVDSFEFPKLSSALGYSVAPFAHRYVFLIGPFPLATFGLDDPVDFALWRFLYDDPILDLLMVRCGDRREGWVFPAKSAAGHLTTVDKQFREARRAAGLPENLVLYSARHDFGTRVLQNTGNLAAVMRVMGHSDPRIAMHYQHPDLDQIRQGLNIGNRFAEATVQ